MYSARHIWHGFRPTISRTLYHDKFSVPQHIKVSKLSTSLCIPSAHLCVSRAPSRFLDLTGQWRLQQRHYSSKHSSSDNKHTLSGSQNEPGSNPPKDSLAKTIHENIYTLPNLLTVSRIAACPVLGWAILSDDYLLATGLLVYAGVTDWVRLNSCCSGSPVGDCCWEVLNELHCFQVDGFLARRYNMQSVMGTILDPAADKALMTTLVVTLAMKDLLPRTLILAFHVAHG